MAFVKVHGTILRSSVWLLDANTRLVWLTLLILANEDGVVEASVGGLAHQARVPRDACAAALDILLSPDPDSRDGSSGERLEAVPGGWLILNHADYRERRTKAQIATAERVARHRGRLVTCNVTGVTGNAVTRTSGLSSPEAEADNFRSRKQKAEAEKTTPSSPSATTTRAGAREAQLDSAHDSVDVEIVEHESVASTREKPPGFDAAARERLAAADLAAVTENATQSNLARISERTKPRPRTVKTLTLGADECAIAQYLFAAIRSHSPTFMADAKPATIVAKLDGWARDIGRGLRNDGMTIEGCRDAIDAAHRSDDDFWHSNLLSGKKLRTHYEKLRIRQRSRQQTTGRAMPDYSGIDFDAVAREIEAWKTPKHSA